MMGLFDVFKKKPVVPSPVTPPARPHPLRGWTNFGVYEVRGINPKTGRQNKKRVEAVDEAGAVALAGLLEPVSAVEVQRPMATERQIEYGATLGLKITERESMVDASALLSMVEDGERPEARITADQWAAACSAGVCISALACQEVYKAVMEAASNAKR